MKRVSALMLFVACAALADVGLKQGSAAIGPVRDISCASDGGLICTRTSASSRGNLFCNGATATEPGCVTPSDQTWSGNKTTTGDVRLVGHAHSSLTACDASHKGNWQTCTTHNAPVFCNGTSNVELAGSSAQETLLSSVYVNGIPPGFLGGFTVASTASWTINAITGFWGAGTGSGTLPITIVGPAGTCTCAVDCDNPLGRTACTGTCTFSGGSTLFLFNTSTCTKDPYVGGNLAMMGLAQ